MTTVLPTGLAASPYANIGTVYEGETPTELAAKAKLDWEVTTVPYTYNVEGDPRSFTSSKFKTCVRADNPEIEFGPVGEKWVPFQNGDLIKEFFTFCEESGSELLRVGSLKEGRTIWAIADTKKKFTVGDSDDEIDGLLLLHNSHMYGKGFNAEVLTWRRICSNGMTLTLKAGRKVTAHRNNLDAARVQSILTRVLNGFKEYEQDMTSLVSTNLTIDQVYTYVIQQFGVLNKEVFNFAKPSLTNLDEQPSAVRKIIQLYQGRGAGSQYAHSFETGFGLIQAITEYVNHHSIQRRGQEAHIQSLWLDAKANKQRQCMGGLLKIASSQGVAVHV